MFLSMFTTVQTNVQQIVLNMVIKKSIPLSITFNLKIFLPALPLQQGGVSWKPIQPVPCFITQSNQMDLNDSLEDIVQTSNEMPIISTVTFPRSDKKSAAQLGRSDVVT